MKVTIYSSKKSEEGDGEEGDETPKREALDGLREVKEYRIIKIILKRTKNKLVKAFIL